MPPAAAILGAAVVGAGASIISGNKASSAQQQAANASIAEQRRQYDQSRADLAPWRDTGGAALAQLSSMYGVNPSGAPAGTNGTAGGLAGDPGSGAYGGFFASPGYQWRQNQGVQAVERSAASRGLLGSGAAVKAIGRYADGLASSEYQNYTDRLAQMAGFGQGAANSTVAAGQAATSGITNAMQAAGNAQASSYLNTGSSINSGINNALYAYMNMGKSSYGGEKI